MYIPLSAISEIGALLKRLLVVATLELPTFVEKALIGKMDLGKDCECRPRRHRHWSAGL